MQPRSLIAPSKAQRRRSTSPTSHGRCRQSQAETLQGDDGRERGRAIFARSVEAQQQVARAAFTISAPSSPYFSVAAPHRRPAVAVLDDFKLLRLGSENANHASVNEVKH